MIHGHGDDLYRSNYEVRANFSTNVWYGADLEGLFDYLKGHLKGIGHYPEPDAGSFRKVAAFYHGLREENVLAGNGATELFYLIAHAFAGGKTLLPVPSFMEYEDACRMYGHELVFLPLKKGEEIPDEGDLVFICNPNNPDGRLYTRAELLALLEANRQVLFVIDQAYADFVTTELLHPADVEVHPNLVLVQSISKAHNLPGLRIGYLVATPEIVKRVARFLIPWSVNAVAVEVGSYVLSHPEQFVLPLRAWLDETAWFISRLNEQGIVEALPTSTTFFLARLRRGKAADLKRYLLETHGILIRDASNFRTLDDRYIRLSTQTREENEALLQVLDAWTK